MLTDEEWEMIKAKWIAEGRMKDDEGYYHFTKSEPIQIYYVEKEDGHINR